MEELYLKSITALKQYDSKPSVKEWNLIAKKHNLLSTKSMCSISKLCWSKLCDEVRKE